MKISIALATYNGEAFLQDQLQSFEMQTRLPDEIIISDDNSTDKTLKILQNFKLETSIIVKIVNNNLGQGAVRNFNNALTHTSGDIILLSDQDDIWLPNKIEIYEDFFQKNCNVQLILSDAVIFRDDTNITERTKLDYFKNSKNNLNNFCTGCCMGFRRSFLELSMPIPFEDYAHDVWLNDIAIMIESRIIIDKVTMYYRRHGGNLSDHVSSITTKINPLTELVFLFNNRQKMEDIHFKIKRSRVMLSHFKKLRLNKPDILNNYDNILGKIQIQIANDMERGYRIKRTFLIRAWLSLGVYFRGGYQKYNGLRSLIKDIFFS